MEKFKRLYVMVGIPGSGKSTFVEKNLNLLIENYKTGIIVSRDQVRFSLVKENEEYFSKEKEVFNTFIKNIKDGLKDYNFVVADATHINEASRKKLLNSLSGSLNNVSVIAVVMNTDLDTCLLRNSNRTSRAYVPEDAIINMYNKFTMPKVEEGFDEIWLCG